MILAETVEERKAALAGIEPFQKEDFKGIYKAMGERPVTIRLLDPLCMNSCLTQTKNLKFWLKKQAKLLKN